MARKNKPSMSSASNISLAHPDRSRLNGKTLLDLASEREASPRVPSFPNSFASIQKSITAPPPPQSTSDTLLTTLLHAITLSALHMTLSLLVAHQYAQTPPSRENIIALLSETVFRTLPALVLLVFPLHTRTAFRFPWLRQVLFFLAGVAAGAHLLWVGNKGAYLAVMRRTPGVATVAVWCVVESSWDWAGVGIALVGFWAWWNGLSAF